MASSATSTRVAPISHAARSLSSGLLLGAPAVAILAGISAEWLDFRALRIPLLLMVGVGVLATAHATGPDRGDWRSFGRAVLIGIATWAAAQTVYAMIHVTSGERFHADRFGAQWSQAIVLIAAHGAFLGAPTGIAAAIILRLLTLRTGVSLT